MKLHLTLDDEFKRIAKQESLSMEALVDEVSRLAGCSTRQMYNYRSGKWLLPAQLIPALCKRFRSRALLDALIDECRATRIDVPDSYDLTRLISQVVRQDLKHYERCIDAFESDGGIDGLELEEITDATERVIQNARQILAIAHENNQRRKRLSLESSN